MSVSAGGGVATGPGVDESGCVLAAGGRLAAPRLATVAQCRHWAQRRPARAQGIPLVTGTENNIRYSRYAISIIVEQFITSSPKI